MSAAWKLVPVNATLEMLDAGLENWQFGDKHLKAVWLDMLNAAPEAPEQVQPAASAEVQEPVPAEAYVGAREDLLIWKRRALEAEETCRQLARELSADVNGPTFMGEPAVSVVPSTELQVPDQMFERWFIDNGKHRLLTVFMPDFRAYIDGEALQHPAPPASGTEVPQECNLDALMALNEWRSALLGLCVGAFPRTASEAAEQVRSRLKAKAMPPQPTERLRVPDRSCVICPKCTHQFRAIPEDVQQRLRVPEGWDEAVDFAPHYLSRWDASAPVFKMATAIIEMDKMRKAR